MRSHRRNIAGIGEYASVYKGPASLVIRERYTIRSKGPHTLRVQRPNGHELGRACGPQGIKEMGGVGYVGPEVGSFRHTAVELRGQTTCVASPIKNIHVMGPGG